MAALVPVAYQRGAGNEELATINEEHENRNQELSAVNSDLNSLLAKVDLATAILRQYLSIWRFATASLQDAG